MDNPFHDLLDRLDHLSGQFDDLRGLIRRAIRLIEKDPEMALTRVRKVLEYVVYDAFERLVKEPPGTRPLENLLQRLVKDGHLPPHLAPYTTFIRELGNAGTHRPEGNYNILDVNVSLIQLRAILDWYFEMVRPDAAAPAASPDPSPTSADPPRPEGSNPRDGPFRDHLAVGKASPSPLPGPEPLPFPAPLPARRGRPWPKIVPAAVLGVLLLGMIVYVTTNKGRIKIAVDDPQAAPGFVPPFSGPAALVDKPPAEPAAVSGPEVVAFYDFNDGTATDRSGHGNHGSLSANPPPFTSQGYQGGALSFDARQQNFITIPVDINPSVMPQITMGGWFNADSATARQPLLSHGDGGFDRALAIDNRGGGGFRWSAFTGSTGSGCFGGASVKPRQWTFVVMRHDHLTGNLTLDVDGQPDKTKAFFGLGDSRTTIGKNPRYPTFFSGKIDNIFIYSGTLGDDKIEDIRSRGEAAILSMIETRKKDRAGKSGPTEGP
jgi:hypothetical protein